jgi:hypothetical protein
MLRVKCSAGRQFSSPKSPTSCSCNPLPNISYMSKYLILIVIAIFIIRCNNTIKKTEDPLITLSEDSVNVKIQEYIVSNIDSLINYKECDCENDWSDLPTASDFKYSKCFQVAQNNDNEFNRYRLADNGISNANFDLIHWNPYWNKDDFKNLFHRIDYWILDNTIVSGDINGDKIEDYAVKVLKKPSGNAQALWITDWYFLISSVSSYKVEKIAIFNGTHREPGYDVNQIKNDTIIGHFQYYNTHLLPFDTESIKDSMNMLVYEYPHNEISFSEKDFYIIPFMTMAKKEKAIEMKEYLKSKYFTSDYLWLPDYPSLSDENQYVAYVGPFSTERMCKLRLRELKKEKLFEDSYGILVSKNNKRKTINIE